MSLLPKNWPGDLPYLTAPLHGKDLTPAHLAAIRTKPSPSPDTPPPPSVPASETLLPCPRVKIQPIPASATLHPARGQRGLFAARDLRPGAFVLAYLGRVHSSAGVSAESDYDIWLDREADVAVDAARQGNEARFVNDYRGVAERPNAEFRPVWCEHWGDMCVGVWVLGGGGEGKKKNKKGEKGVKKGEEILVSYGKGFWQERRREMEEGIAEEVAD